ncbi:hypothetical protein [Streptococcus iniae]|uniref:hypothetical protein n=1 Tax=Streptococcus iniae TaxID=1346 RepID=UPI001604E415|nr:hypothetical protein [Streptococcus iniae]
MKKLKKLPFVGLKVPNDFIYRQLEVAKTTQSPLNFITVSSENYKKSKNKLARKIIIDRLLKETWIL